MGKRNEHYEIIIEDKSCKLRKPNRFELKIALSKMASDPGNYLEVGQILLNSCWIEGDKELKDDQSDENAEYNMAACMQAMGMIQIKTGELKKL